jgi:acyl carrier protein
MQDQNSVRAFVVETLSQMNYDVSDVTGTTVLGPAGLDLESLALADLAVQVEEKFGVTFELDDMEGAALMNLDEFAAEVCARVAGLTALGGAR